MPINSDKPHLWKADVAQSIDFYNDWFLRYRPKEIPAAFEESQSQEKRQYALLKRWLLRRGYKQIASGVCSSLDAFPPGSFSFCHTSTTGKKTASANVPTHCIVKPVDDGKVRCPVIIAAKSSESISSSVRRAKKDARKSAAFKEHYEKNARLILLLCGYYDGYYLGPQAAEGIDWVWQHRLDDLKAYLFKNGSRSSLVISENE